MQKTFTKQSCQLWCQGDVYKDDNDQLYSRHLKKVLNIIMPKAGVCLKCVAQLTLDAYTAGVNGKCTLLSSLLDMSPGRGNIRLLGKHEEKSATNIGLHLCQKFENQSNLIRTCLPGSSGMDQHVG